MTTADLMRLAAACAMTRSSVRTVIGVIVIGVVAFAGLTLLALELDGVIVVHTTVPGSPETRATHVWYVQRDGRLLLEAGSPENPWVKDVVAGGALRVEGWGLDGTYDVTIRREDSHDVIREHMRSKYGWRDTWISILFDTSRSFMIEATRSGEGASSRDESVAALGPA